MCVKLNSLFDSEMMKWWSITLHKC